MEEIWDLTEDAPKVLKKRVREDISTIDYALEAFEILSPSSTPGAVTGTMQAISFSAQNLGAASARLVFGHKKPMKSSHHSKSSGNGVGYSGQAGENLSHNANVNNALVRETARDEQVRNAFRHLRGLVSEGMELWSMNHLEVVLLRLQHSISLLRILREYLLNDSLLNIGARRDCYTEILLFLSALARDQTSAYSFFTQSLDDTDVTSRATILALLTTLGSQAIVFVQLNQSSEVDMLEALTVALHIQQTLGEVQKTVDISRKYGLSQSNSQSKESSTPAPTEEQEYLRVLRPQRFEVVDLLGSLATGQMSHYLYQKSAQAVGHAGVVGDARTRQARIANEISTLSTSLPVEMGSSIFVRCDDSRLDVLKALVIGPEGTPYANGCFEFDIMLPPHYPQGPPLVHFLTTGRGSVRFNPNLYNCGKVCLSLLGTWAGPGWDAATSTLLQVLVSIQSLILVPDPYYNEPGYPRNPSASDAYNKSIMFETMRWAILDQLKAPSPIFREVIKDHFRLKRVAVMAQLEVWAQQGAAQSVSRRPAGMAMWGQAQQFPPGMAQATGYGQQYPGGGMPPGMAQAMGHQWGQGKYASGAVVPAQVIAPCGQGQGQCVGGIAAMRADIVSEIDKLVAEHELLMSSQKGCSGPVVLIDDAESTRPLHERLIDNNAIFDLTSDENRQDHLLSSSWAKATARRARRDGSSSDIRRDARNGGGLANDEVIFID